MGNLTRIIELYESKGVDEVLKAERLWSEQEELKLELKSKDPQEREMLEERFQNLLKALEDNVQNINREMKKSENRMESSQKNMEACIRYIETSIGEKSDKKKG